MEPKTSSPESYREILSHIVHDVAELARNEYHLAHLESREVGYRLTRHALLAAIFGGILAVSVLPLVAFLVIGLGELLGGNYWLSSLIIGVLGVSLGGSVSYAFIKKIKDDDLRLPHTRTALKASSEVIGDRLDEIKSASKGIQDERQPPLH